MAKILLVDDEVQFLELLKFELTSEGFEVFTACNEEEFRMRAFSEKPDLIILDIMLGDKNGPLVYDELLAEGLLDRSVPVIFLSALVQDRPPIPVTAGRNYALHGKPFESEKLIQAIRSLIKAA